MNLFKDAEQQNRDSAKPLAARMRPAVLSEFAGQQHILADGKLLRRMLDADRIGSMIFYGPPGTGKTTLAELLAAIPCTRNLEDCCNFKNTECNRPFFLV